MKLAWLLPNLHVTGGSRVAVELMRRLGNNGHRVYIVVPKGRVKLNPGPSVTVIEAGISVKSPLFTIPAAGMGMMTSLPEVDLIIGSMPPYALLAKSIARLRGVKAINYVLNDDVHFFDDKTFLKSDSILSLYRMVARLSIRHRPLFANSHWTATRIMAEDGPRAEFIIPHGFDPEYFFASNGKELSKITRLVTVGRSVKWKGFEDLISALNLLDQKETPFSLKIISQDNLDLSRVNFPAELVKPTTEKELADHFRSGDIFLYSSWFEGFGMPPLEAIACGLPVVSTDCGGVKEFLRNEENALLTPPREPKEMARAIRRLILDTEMQSRFTAVGLETASQFTWDRVAARFEMAINSIISAN